MIVLKQNKKSWKNVSRKCVFHKFCHILFGFCQTLFYFFLNPMAKRKRKHAKLNILSETNSTSVLRLLAAIRLTMKSTMEIYPQRQQMGFGETDKRTQLCLELHSGLRYVHTDSCCDCSQRCWLWKFMQSHLHLHFLFKPYYSVYFTLALNKV